MSLLKSSGIASRFFLAPINTGYAQNGIPTSHLIDFHRERAGIDIGVAYVGNVAVDKSFQTNKGTAVMSDDYADVWQNLAKTIEHQGSVPAIQLACRYSPVQSSPSWVCKDSNQLIESTANFIKELPSADIMEVCEQFIRAAEHAANAGFKIIQVHAAHGYLLALLLNRLLNKRDDDFSDGCFALRLIADGIIHRVSDCILDVRVSIFDGLEDRAAEINYRSSQIAQLTSTGYRIVSLSAGMYDVDRRLIYPGEAEGIRPYLMAAIKFANDYPETIWNVAGRLGSLRDLVQKDPQNLTFSVGRPLIADPKFVEKSLSERENEITHCALTGKCHYFSRGKPHIECGVNKAV